MGQRKPKSVSERALKGLGDRLTSAVRKSGKRKKVSGQFKVFSKEILDIGTWIPNADPGADSSWLNEMGTGLNNVALGLSVLEDCDINEQPETFESVSLLTDGLTTMAESLADAGESFAAIKVPKGGDKEINMAAIRLNTSELVFDTGMLAHLLGGAVGIGLNDDYVSIRLPVFSSTCGCDSNQPNSQIGEHVLDSKILPIDERTEFSFDGLLLVENLERVGELLQRLFALFIEFAALILVMATGYIPWHCTQDCTGDGALLGAKLKRTHAKRLGSGWYQPQITITWEYCCYNLCVLAWNDQFVSTVDSGPHNIGRSVGNPNPVKAQNMARAAAKTRATLQAMLRIGAPGSPC